METLTSTRLTVLLTLNFTGIAVSELQPFGGPRQGGTQVVIFGRLFAVQGPSILCKFGNLSMVAATFLSDTALRCEAPPNPHVRGAFEDHALEVTLNGEPNFLTASRVPFVYTRRPSPPRCLRARCPSSR